MTRIVSKGRDQWTPHRPSGLNRCQIDAPIVGMDDEALLARIIPALRKWSACLTVTAITAAAVMAAYHIANAFTLIP